MKKRANPESPALRCSIRKPPQGWKRCVADYMKRKGCTERQAVRDLLSQHIGPYDPEHGKFGW